MGDDVDVVLVGSGPQSLAVALALRARDPGISVRAVDPAGRWLGRWDERFERLGIERLRSPVGHHPHADSGALGRWCDAHGARVSGLDRLPPADLFAGFCRSLVDAHDLDASLVAGRATALDVAGDHVVVRVAPPRDRRHGGAGRTAIRARAVVVATGLGRPRIPAWAAIPGTRARRAGVLHADEVDVRTARPGARVLVVGGGLTAAQLALGAVRGGARPTLLVRRHLQRHPLDVEPLWLWPRHVAEFHAQPDPVVRRAWVDRARRPGSCPAAVVAALHDCARRGVLDLREASPVSELDDAPEGQVVARLASGERLEADELWLGTGWRCDVEEHPLLAPLLTSHPVPVAGGLPALDDTYRWPGTPVHVVGALGALAGGPAAGNLKGARRAASIVAEAVAPDRPAPVDHGDQELVATPSPVSGSRHSECPSPRRTASRAWRT